MERKKTQYVGSIEKELVMVTVLLILAASLLLTSSCTTTSKCGINGHEYVDMGLPSKTVWATCNVGAKKAEDYGNFYAWGETMPKNDYSWETYTLPYDSIKISGKTVLPNNREFNDKWNYYRLKGRYTMNTEKMKLLPEDDAATVNWGKSWSTPTVEQWNELCDTSLCHWEQQMKGFLVTSKKNGKSIFLPACGTYNGKEAPKTYFNEGDSVRYDGAYWSGTLVKEKMENTAPYLRFNTGYQRMRQSYITTGRQLSCGMSIRPVAKLPE